MDIEATPCDLSPARRRSPLRHRGARAAQGAAVCDRRSIRTCRRASCSTAGTCGRSCSTCSATPSSSRRRAKCSCVSARDRRRRLRFDVVDTGIGIEAENLSAVFQAFPQTRSGAELGGTGLGLTISHHLVRGMGGELKVESTPGKGSRFYFELPLVEAEELALSGSRRRRWRGALLGRAARAGRAPDGARRRRQLGEPPHPRQPARERGRARDHRGRRARGRRARAARIGPTSSSWTCAWPTSTASRRRGGSAPTRRRRRFRSSPCRPARWATCGRPRARPAASTFFRSRSGPKCSSPSCSATPACGSSARRERRSAGDRPLARRRCQRRGLAARIREAAAIGSVADLDAIAERTVVGRGRARHARPPHRGVDRGVRLRCAAPARRVARAAAMRPDRGCPA